jgi:hypothetical protein
MPERYLDDAFEELKKRLGWSNLDTRIRNELIAHDHDLIVHAYPSGEEDEWEDLKRVARKIARLLGDKAGQRSPAGRTPKEERPIWQLKDEELERSWAFSEYVAKFAATDSEVMRFRSRYLGGDVVEACRARVLLASPAAAIWPAPSFRWSGFPVLDHSCEVVERGRDNRGEYALVEARDPASGATKRFKDRRPLETGAWSIPERARDALSNSEETREIGGWGLLSFPDSEGGVTRVYVRADSSVLGALRKLIHKLLQTYPWWESEAVWFVLTGENPWVAPVTLQARGSGSPYGFQRQFVTLKVEPWVSEETVRRTYREAQLHMLRGDNRPAKSKQLNLFRFVSSRTDPTTLYGRERARVARELLPEWDRENPDDAYRGDTRRFWRDYDRAVRLIALPLEAAKHRERTREPRERLRGKR